MQIGLGLWLGSRSGGGAALMSSVSTLGWQGEWSSTPPPTFDPVNSPVLIPVSQAGYTAVAGYPGSVSTTTYSDTIIPTIRYRDAAPSEATLKTATVVFDDAIYSTTTIPGVVNNSTVASPKSVAQWSTAGRQLIDAASPNATGGVICSHRDGIAAVQVIMRDSLGTEVTQTITAPTFVSRAGDFSGVEEWVYSIDCTPLAAGLIRRRFIVYPLFGGAASVLDSNDTADHTRGPATVIDAKATKYYVYVDTATGNDTTGVASTSAATAEASPCATIPGAFARARVLMPGNRVSGLEIRLNAGTYNAFTVAFNTYQNADTAEVILTRNPNVARANVILSYGAASSFNLLYLRVQDLTMERTASVNFSGNLTGQLVFRDITWTGIATPSTAVQSGIAVYYEGGIQFPTGLALAGHLNSTNIWMIRGCTGGDQATASTMINYHIAGCNIRGASVGGNSQPESNGLMVESYLSQGTTATAGFVTIAGTAGATVNGYLARNLVIEYTNANASGANTPRNALGLSPDGTGANTNHVMVLNITIAGVSNGGRANVGYDESAGTTRRTHTLMRVDGCIFPQLNHKSDRFVAYNQGNLTDAPFRIGAHSVTHGVGFGQNLVCSLDAANAYAGQSRVGAFGGFSQEFDGRGTIKTITSTVIDPLYTSPACCTLSGSTYTSGAGGGVYTLQTGSPARNAMTRRAYTPAFGLSGASRGAVGAVTSIGAYA